MTIHISEDISLLIIPTISFSGLPHKKDKNNRLPVKSRPHFHIQE